MTSPAFLHRLPSNAGRHLWLGLALAGLVFIAACKPQHPEAPPSPPIDVTVAKPVQQPVRNYQMFDGTVAASREVSLEARVPGYLDQINFQDGARVKQGDLLFVIEQDQYQQQVKLSEAIYQQAKQENDRQNTMLAQRATSQAAVDKARSDLQQAEANLALARINLGYTEIRAPFDGVMGRHLIDAGNYLAAGVSGVQLATIRRLQPVYVYFSMNENDVLRFMRANGESIKAGERLVGSLPVYAALQGEDGFPHTGVLDFAASDLGSSTGALELRASFPNTELGMVPGMYAQVLVFSGPARQALLLPFDAVMSDQQGQYVFVVDDKQTAQRRNVATGQRQGALIEVTQGLEAGDAVVINGIVALSAGRQVKAAEGTIEPVALPGHGG